jgi:hypothetical protein
VGSGESLLSERNYRLGYASAALAGEDRTGPYLLPHRPLLGGSEIVLLHGAALERDKDYWIRYENGELTFVSPLRAGEKAEIRYRFLPLAVPLERFRNELRLTEGEEPVVAPARAAAPMTGPLDTGTLRVGGSKSFAVVIGSGRALSLEQALRVSVEGNLAPDVRVTARLTDQNLPFGAEGRSERLEELDQVLIRAESPRFDVTLGDYEIRYEETEFGRYERVLKGAVGKWRGNGYEIEGSGGLSKGVFRSVELRGVEGKQGPYSILDASALGQVVVSGSETVWLDGTKLVRGDGNDYVVDYSAGTITLNPSRPVFSESRIAVDFQTSGDEYRRSFATGRFRIGEETSRFRLRGALLAEADDDDEPEALALSEAERDSLRVSGDRSPLGSTARFIGEGGDYDSLGGVFVYAGADSGAFDVSFREVARGEGSYVDSISEAWGQRIFAHVGAGKGDYEPTVPIPLPSSHRVFVLNGGVRPVTPLLLAGEAAWSALDRNVLSSADDGDNAGSGALLTASLAETPLRAGDAEVASISFSGSHRSVTERFEPLGRYRELHRDDRWMTVDLRRAIGPGRNEEDRVGSGEAFRARGAESMTAASGALGRGLAGGNLSLAAEGGRLSAGGFGSDRWSWTSGFDRPGRLRALYEEERIASEEGDSLDGETIRRTGEASVRAGWGGPSVRVVRARRAFEREGRLDRGSSDREERLGLDLGSGGRIEARGAVTFQARDYGDSSTGSWLKWYDGRTDEVSLRLRGPVSAGAEYTHRVLEYGPTVTEGSGRSDLGRLEVRHGGLGGALLATWNYEVTSEERKRRERLLLRAPAGQEADYDSLGNYFPGEGTFNQVLIEGEPEPVLDLEAGATVRLEPGRRREWKGGPWWTRLSSETFLRVEERSTAQDRTPLLLLDPRAFQRNETTQRGVTTVRQEFRWTDPGSEASLRLRLQREDREENEYRNLLRDDLVRTLLVRAKVPLARGFSGEMEWNRRLEEERSNDERAVDLAGDEWKAALLYDPAPAWRFRIPAGYRDERESVREERVRSVLLEPEAAWNLAARSRLDASATWTRFLEEDLDRKGSFLRDRKEGIRWRLQFAYEWNSVLSSTVAYGGENWKDEPMTQQFRAEMRAFF